jgi:hypothetical protein
MKDIPTIEVNYKNDPLIEGYSFQDFLREEFAKMTSMTPPKRVLPVCTYEQEMTAELEKVAKLFAELPPMPIGITFTKAGYKYFKAILNVKISENQRPVFNSIPIYVVNYNDDDLEDNEIKVSFNDGSSKTYKWCNAKDMEEFTKVRVFQWY